MWTIDCQHCDQFGQCTRNLFTANTKDEAIDKVLGELEWRRHSRTPALRFVMQDTEWCFEDEVTSDLMNGQFQYTTGSGSRVSYHLYENN